MNKDIASARIIRALIMVPALIMMASLVNVWMDTQVCDDKYVYSKFLRCYFLVLFLGEYCEIDASVCNETMCKNSGECIEGPGFSFYCRCREGRKFVKLLLRAYKIYFAPLHFLFYHNGTFLFSYTISL